MSDWEDDVPKEDNEPKEDNVPRKQSPRKRISGGNVRFGMRSAGRGTDEREAREPAERGRGHSFQWNRPSRPLVFNVEKPATGRIIGKLPSL